MKNIEEKITCFKDKKHKPKKRYKNHKTLNTKLKLLDYVIIGATSISIILSITGVGLTFSPISVGVAATLLLENKVLHRMIKKDIINTKKEYEKDQQTIKSFDKLYRKSFQDKLIHTIEQESLCNVFTKYWDETKKKESSL